MMDLRQDTCVVSDPLEEAICSSRLVKVFLVRLSSDASHPLSAADAMRPDTLASFMMAKMAGACAGEWGQEGAEVEGKGSLLSM